MSLLEYTFKNDVLFKMFFVQNQDLLKNLVSELLNVKLENIEEFEVTNSEVPPENLGDKFCHLDINMTINGQRVDLEIQVKDENDYPERSLYYWAREYSSALGEGCDYINLPRTIIISILAFKLFECKEFHSEFKPMEITRHTELTDKQVLHYFELPKLPEGINKDDKLKLWLTLFKAETEEQLKQIEVLEVPIMKKAIKAYRNITATSEFKESERLYSLARHNEAAALRHARDEATKMADEKWTVVVANKDSVIANKDTENAKLQRKIAELQKRLGMKE